MRTSQEAARAADTGYCVGEVLPKPLRIVLGAIALLTLAACAFSASDGSRIEKATQPHMQGNSWAAVTELKKILQKHPDNCDARPLSGEISLLTSQAAAAEKEFRDAQQLGVQRDNVVIPLGRALMDQGDCDRALQEVDASGIGDEKVKANVLLLRGEAHLALHKLGDAERTLREVLVLRHDPRIGLVAGGTEIRAIYRWPRQRSQRRCPSIPVMGAHSWQTASSS